MKKNSKKSMIARGKFAKVLVFRGIKLKTVGGVTRDGLMKNKRGKVVSKRQSAHGRRMFTKNCADWLDAFMAAREALHVTGFIAINSTSLLGKALYVKAKALSLMKKRSMAGSPVRAACCSLTAWAS
eukprot:NODE_16837_length_974_cov_18.623377.p2 GENE.NODE_16837_length_974_cov_18.623377~~NODE_16837_length_974_cov_18.623377.p2  ORF type:complete len:127 (+),score=24.33 NODE_16837_length_974_cov_18.623377:101-481(+)